MSGILDKFLGLSPSQQIKEKEERCSNPKCRKILKPTDPKYTLTIKGKKGNYCPTCAKKILRPQENTEENL